MKHKSVARRAVPATDPVIRRFFVATFLYTFAHAVGIPLIPEFLEIEYGSSLRFVGLVMGLYGLMQIVLRLPMGDMADSRGRKPSILVALGCAFASGVILILATSQWWAIPAVAFFGLSGGIFWVAANSYLFDRVGEGDIARATLDYSVAVGLAFLAGPAIGHVIADVYGFRWAFATYLATTLVGLLMVLTLPETPPEPRPKPTTSSYRRAWLLLRHPALMFSAFGTFLYSLLFSTLNSFFQLHVLAVGLSITVAGVLISTRQAAAVLVRLGLPPILKRFGPVNALLAGVVATALATALVPFASNLWTLAVVAIVAGAATGVMIPANLMLVHAGAPKRERGLANGIYGTMLGLGAAAAPWSFGLLSDRLGLPWAFWGAAAVALSLATVLAFSKLRRQTAWPR